MFLRTPQATREKQDEELFIRHYIYRVWLRTWGTMFHYNAMTSVRETREGFRSPRAVMHARTRKTGPYPQVELNESGEHRESRRPGTDVLGTLATPVVVGGSRATQRR